MSEAINFSLKVKRILGIVTLAILGYLIYPVIFSESRPERHVDETSQIPARPSADHPAVKAQNKMVITPSNLDRELAEHRKRQQQKQRQQERELEQKLWAEQLAEPPVAEAITDASAAETNGQKDSPAASALPRAWVIQVVSFTDQNKSQQVLDKLRANGYKAFITKVDLTDSTRYRVMVGPYINPANSKRDKQAIGDLIATRPVILNY